MNVPKYDESGDRFLKFNFGELTHPIHGTVKQFEATIPLLKSDINFTPLLKTPGSLQKSLFKEIAEQLLRKCRPLFEEDLDDDILEKIQLTALKAFLLVPSYCATATKQKEFELLVRFLLLRLTIDGFFDILAQDAFLDEKSTSNPTALLDMDSKAGQMLQAFTKCLRTKEFDSDDTDMPTLIPALRALIPSVKIYTKDLKEGVPDYKTRIEPLKKESQKTFYRALSIAGNVSAGEESTDFTFAGMTAGTILELLAFLNKTEIRPEMRKTEEFKGFLEVFYQVCAVICAIFELSRDVELDRTSHSAILKSAVEHGKSLQEEFDSYFERLMKGLTTVAEAAATLRKSNPNDLILEKFIQTAEEYVNWLLYWYAYNNGTPENGVYVRHKF